MTGADSFTRACGAGLAALFGVCYLVSVLIGWQFYYESNTVATFWPANGLLLGVLLASPYRYWAGFLLAGILAELVIDVGLKGQPTLWGIAWSMANALESFIAAFLVRRLSYKLADLDRLGNTAVLVLGAAIVGPAVSATIGASVATTRFPDEPYWHAWQLWLLADALGIIAVTPPVLAWIHGSSLEKGPGRLEVGLVSVVALALTYIVFSAPKVSVTTALQIPYVVFPFVLWAALRFSARASTTLTLAVVLMVVWYGDHDAGPLVLGDNVYLRVLTLQAFLASFTLSTLFISTVVNERRRLTTALSATKGAIESFFENSPHVMLFRDLEGRYARINRRAEQLFGASRDEGIGKRATEVFSAELAARIDEPHIRAREHGEISTWEGEVRYRDTEVYLHNTVFPVSSDAGELLGTATISTDIGHLKRAEQALSQSETRYRYLFEASPVAVWEMDWSGVKTLFDALRESGVDNLAAHLAEHPDVLEECWRAASIVDANAASVELYDARDKTHFFESLDWRRECINEDLTDQLFAYESGEYRRVYETHDRRITGEQFAARVTVAIPLPHRDTWQKVYRAVEDISDRAAAEARLRASESRYRRLFEAAPVALFEDDWSNGKQLVDSLKAQGVDDIAAHMASRPELVARASDVSENLGVNTEALQLYGAPDASSFVGWMGQLPEILTSLENRLDHLAKGARRAGEDSVRQRMDGKSIVVRSISEIVTDDPHDWSRVLTSEIDLTELTETETALRESESRLREAQRIAHIGSWECDFDRSWEVWSEELYRIFGLAPDSVTSASEAFWQAVHEHDRGRVRERFERSFAEHTEHEMRYRIVRPDGTVRVIEERARPVVTQGDELHMQGTVRDVTDEVEDEKEKARLEAQLHQSQKMQAIGNLAGGIAHDFNNLLTVVIGNLSFLAEELASQAELLEVVDDARSAADDGATLVERLVSFARPQPENIEALDLNEVLRTTDSWLVRALPSSVTIDWQYHPAPILIRLDRVQLETVILNLAINAGDAMPNGGTLSIETQVTTLAEPGASFARLTVTDNGTGMPPEVVERACEPFFSTKPRERGTGLGLSMAYGFVQQLGGRLEIQSKLGAGTSIEILLPTTDESSPVDPVAAPERIEGARGRERVLVVEDNDKVRQFAVKVLQRRGYLTDEAENADQALQRLSDGTHVDLVFTDIRMPGSMDGHELAALTEQRYPDVRILLTTGSRDVQPAVAPAGDDARLLKKPYRAEDLTRMVRDVLDR